MRILGLGNDAVLCNLTSKYALFRLDNDEKTMQKLNRPAYFRDGRNELNNAYLMTALYFCVDLIALLAAYPQDSDKSMRDVVLRLRDTL
jgi:hypothetical protein